MNKRVASAAPGAAGRARLVGPGEFVPERHFYPKALEAVAHPDVQAFLALESPELARRYLRRHPAADGAMLEALLGYRPRFFAWAGADLIPVVDEGGGRHMAVIEINSCPSGQKSLPLCEPARPDRGYRRLIERTFLPMLEGASLPAGGLAVIYDKNPMEASGYAAVIADLTGEPVARCSRVRSAPIPASAAHDAVPGSRRSFRTPCLSGESTAPLRG